MHMCIVKKVLLAGLAGGLAEVVWVTLFASLTPVSAVEVARQVTATVFPSAVGLGAAPALGIAVHLALSLALGMAFAWAVWIPFARRLDFPGAMVTAIGVLAGVWAVNFFVVLPVLNPVFVTLMPYGASLISKALFGVAMAWTLEGVGREPGLGGVPNWSVSRRS